jgi:ADP-heptose:LPS heptosyltransferase
MLYIEEFLGAEWLSTNIKLVGINISASSRWLTKNLPLPHLVKICEALGRKDMRVVITGTEKDSAAAEKLLSLVKNVSLINACGKTTLNQLACLIKKCSAYISCDSAPLHIAAAMKTPLVAIFGPTDPARHLPLAKNCILIKKDLPCSPCYKSKCKTVKCMKMITVEEILGAVESLLK